MAERCHAGTWRIDVVILLAEDRPRQSRLLATIVHAERKHRQLTFLVLHRHLTITAHSIDANTKAVTAAEATSEIERRRTPWPSFS